MELSKQKKWLKKYNIKIAIYCHIHARSSKFEDEIKFEEVFFGYPRDLDEIKGMDYYLREILAS